MASIVPSPVVSKQPVALETSINSLMKPNPQALPEPGAWVPSSPASAWTAAATPPITSCVPTPISSHPPIKQDTNVGIAEASAIVGAFVGVAIIGTVASALWKFFRKMKQPPGVEDVETQAANPRLGDKADAKITRPPASHQSTRPSDLAAAATVTDSRWWHPIPPVYTPGNFSIYATQQDNHYTPST
ncbi:uncharacterized protein BDZ99DRAFT_457227 [Mytilinidion resinicola]|uniref:Uncharacterized protein n=1 Tax=Mytilinidion resinicola TaxID=574789 RepID=A0A6A6Z902_9PEZI|nr:uncharacterized protein BDZ99DRAFT_457227 [Mytilinidion resinicola]KAF2817496.1 hypothetical protein BDZ99DRAFT_457227 [Mytilinidion resinicola]